MPAGGRGVLPRVYVGAGSNSEPRARLRAAVAALERAFGPVRRSAVYRTAAVGMPASDYLNLVVAFDSDLRPAAVKAALVAIEAAAGRQRDAVPSAVCVVDLDLLLYGARVDAPCRLPHPDVLRRAFVLAPLADVAPELRHPVTGEPVASAWRRLAESATAIENVGGLETIE
jgi:2-amino-4-hydroxy-6-hydroxymethyldihydropteridine diphosphokinase